MQWSLGQLFIANLNSASNDSQGDVAGLVTILIILLLVATVVALVTQQLRVPYVTGLVLAGLPEN
jgi:CPA1 family monovalent cation:H+ antiporter